MHSRIFHILALVGVVLCLGTAPSSSAIVTLHNTGSSAVYYDVLAVGTSCGAGYSGVGSINAGGNAFYAGPAGSCACMGSGTTTVFIYGNNTDANNHVNACMSTSISCATGGTVNVACGTPITKYEACVGPYSNNDCLMGVPWTMGVIRGGVFEPVTTGNLAYHASPMNWCYSHTNAFTSLVVTLDSCTNENGVVLSDTPTTTSTYDPGDLGEDNDDPGDGTQTPADESPHGTNDTVNDDAIIKALKELGDKLAKKLDTLDGSIDSAASGITDAIEGIDPGTNSGSLGPTNWITQAWGDALTNLAISTGTAFKGSLSMLPATATNWQSGWENASNSLYSSGVPQAFDALKSHYDFDTNYTTGTAPDLTFDFCGYSFSFNPETTFMSNILYWLYGVNVFALLVWYAYWLVDFVRQMTADMTQTQGGGIPNIDATILGVGGNAIGITVFIAVGLAMVAAWRAVFTWLLGGLLTGALSPNDYAGGLMSFNGSALAVWFFVTVYPINLFLSLVMSRLGLTILGAKILGIVGLALRLMPTK